MVAWHIKKSFDCKWHVCTIMQYILIRDLRICNLLIKAFILIFCHFAFFSVPNGLESIELLPIESDRVAYEIAKLINNFFNLMFLGELSAISPELDGHFGTPFKIEIGSIADHKFT